MKPQLFVFDLDGTLVDSSEDLATAVNAALAAVAPGAPRLPLALVRTLIGHGAENLVARSLQEAGVDRIADEVLPLFLDSYKQCLLDRTRLYPGVEEALNVLSDRTLAVLTNKPGDLSRQILQGLGVADRFARIYGGGDVPGKKPDPAGLLRLLQETRIAADRALIVGDSGVDVRTGRAAGVRTAGVTYGFDAGSLEADPPDLVVADLRELASLIDTPR